VTPHPQSKIAYVLTFDPSAGSGLWLRLKERLDVWQNAGVSADIFICCRKSSALVLEPPTPGHRIHLLTGTTPFLASFGLPRRLASLNPDLIYMRYNLPYPSMIEVARRWPTILEIHSDDKLEWEQRPRRYRMMGTVFRPFLFRQVAAMVMVDPELLRSSSFPVEKIPSTAISNGIRIPADIRYDGSRQRRSGPPRLVLSVGNTESWQGIDKFLALALRQPDLEFHLLGLDAAQLADCPRNVTVHGRLQPGDVTSFLSTMDIGVGNLALERASRHSPSPLKVREYVATGLPCIIAHDDPDLDGMDGMLNLGYGFTDLQQAAVAVGDFAQRWTGRTCSLAMADSVDLSAKEAERQAFFEATLRLHPPRGRS
jgi:hypothetical protein